MPKIAAWQRELAAELTVAVIAEGSREENRAKLQPLGLGNVLVQEDTDVAGRYLWTKLPILAMYRPHKLFWFDELMREGRNRGAAPDGTNTAPATMAGVRMLLKHLRSGGCSIVLPDQVPGTGDGEWVDFFGRPAYTMTLVGRLQEASKAALVFCFAERLPNGEGFVLHCRPVEGALPAQRRESARQVNERVEELVRMCPSQYLWGYNRYKQPAGAPPPPTGAS